MNAGRQFTPKEFIFWTRRTIYKVFILSLVPTLCYYFGAKFLSLPWQPIAILGTAVAFIVGFKNNASYARLWEARQIYGAIINDSRAFAYTLRDALNGNPEEVKKNILSPFCVAHCITISIERNTNLGKYAPKTQSGIPFILRYSRTKNNSRRRIETTFIKLGL